MYKAQKQTVRKYYRHYWANINMSTSNNQTYVDQFGNLSIEFLMPSSYTWSDNQTYTFTNGNISKFFRVGVELSEAVNDVTITFNTVEGNSLSCNFQGRNVIDSHIFDFSSLGNQTLSSIVCSFSASDRNLTYLYDNLYFYYSQPRNATESWYDYYEDVNVYKAYKTNNTYKTLRS